MTDLAQAAAWHRQIAALVEAADRAGVAEDHLPAVRARLLAQQGRFAESAARRGAPLPPLLPTPAEIAAAAPALGDLSVRAVAQAMRTVAATLDATDAALAGQRIPAPAAPPSRPPTADTPSLDPPDSVAIPTATGPITTGPITTGPTAPGAFVSGSTTTGATPSGAGSSGAATRQTKPTSATARNVLIYAGYALFVLVAQLAMLATLDEERTLPLLAPICLGVLPAFAWAAGWLTIGAAFPSPAGEKVDRSPRLGAVVCALPDVALCAGLGVLFLIR